MKIYNEEPAGGVVIVLDRKEAQELVNLVELATQSAYDFQRSKPFRKNSNAYKVARALIDKAHVF